MVASQAHYRPVADLMFARYSRPFDVGIDGPPAHAVQLRRDLPACLLLLAEKLSCPECLRDLAKRLLSLFTQLAISGQLRAHAPQPGKGTRRNASPSSTLKRDFVQMLAGILPALATAMERAGQLRPAAAGEDAAAAPGSDASPVRLLQFDPGGADAPSSSPFAAVATGTSFTNPNPARAPAATPPTGAGVASPAQQQQPKGAGGVAPSSSVRLVRNVWFYCALLGFVPEGGGREQEAREEREGREHWQQRWDKAAKQLARASPVLLIANSQSSFVSMTLQLNDFASMGVTEVVGRCASETFASASRIGLAIGMNIA